MSQYSDAKKNTVHLQSKFINVKILGKRCFWF